jgi:hypothetical protein
MSELGCPFGRVGCEGFDSTGSMPWVSLCSRCAKVLAERVKSV